jgi:hypothetical protein
MVTATPSVMVFPASSESSALVSNQISFTPLEAWSTVSLEESNLTSACGGSLSPYRKVTNVVNATISFNYTGQFNKFSEITPISPIEGPAIMIRTIPSRTGGVFSVVIDGFNTTCFIDTYIPNADTPEEARGKGLNFSCYSVHQFPPVNIRPPGYESREAHTVSLVYIGETGNTEAQNLSGQFDSFALPIYSEDQMSAASTIQVELVLSLFLLATGSYFLL